MYWENIVFDAADPRGYGTFWEDLLQSETLTDNDGGYESRLHFPGSCYLDLCFPKVDSPGEPNERVQLVLGAGSSAGNGSGDRAGAGLEERIDYAGHRYLVQAPDGEAAALRLDAVQIQSSNPGSEAEFWSKLTGWQISGHAPATLVHPVHGGPALVLVQESSPKTSAKYTMHLDLRMEADDNPEEALGLIQSLGGRELHPDWGQLPWRVFQDPSGNEFCILPSPVSAD